MQGIKQAYLVACAIVAQRVPQPSSRFTLPKKRSGATGRMLVAEPDLLCHLLTGTGYMRSTNKAIAALKATFQTPLYPLLDQVRSALGAKIDQELAHLKVTQHAGHPAYPTSICPACLSPDLMTEHTIASIWHLKKCLV